MQKRKKGTPPGSNPAARGEQNGWGSGFDGIGSFAVLSFRGRDRQAHLLANGSRQKTTYAMRLPTSRLHQLGQASSVGSFQQIENLGGFAAVPGLTSLFRGLGRLLGGLGLLGRLALSGPNVGALLASAGLLAGFRLLASRLGGSGFFNGCVHVISFRGNRRGDDINHASAPKMQVNFGRIANESHQ